MKVVVRIIDKEWRTAAWRLCGCDVKWGCAGDRAGAFHVIVGLGLELPTVAWEVFENGSGLNFRSKHNIVSKPP